MDDVIFYHPLRWRARRARRPACREGMPRAPSRRPRIREAMAGAAELTPVCRTHADGLPVSCIASAELRKEMPQTGVNSGARGIPSLHAGLRALRALQRSGW